jgi:formylglycine-generating enzyme required for sulfatase activity
VRIGPIDWEAEGKVRASTLNVGAFAIERGEVNGQRWQRCQAARRCTGLPRAAEPGVPVAGVSAEAAQAFCAFEGGRLPTSSEWIYAASGSDGRRYPWGNTGLVCRRASYGLKSGPCAEGAHGPTLGGARPDGKTPEGLYDMVGNVKEWAAEKDGSFSAMGGSYRSSLAGELKSWAREERVKASPDLGFRCAYDN